MMNFGGKKRYVCGVYEYVCGWVVEERKDEKGGCAIHGVPCV